jgi:paraquat-inducible protein B
MVTDPIIRQLQELQLQMKGAIDVHEGLKAELVKQQLLHQQLTVEKQTVEKEVEALKEQLKTLKLAQALAGTSDQDTRALKQQINGYIREIDKCLTLLNRN